MTTEQEEGGEGTDPMVLEAARTFEEEAMREYYTAKGGDVNLQMLNLAPEEHTLFGSSVDGKVFHGKTPIAFIGGASIEAINKVREERNQKDPIITYITEIGDELIPVTIKLGPINSEGEAEDWQISNIGEERKGISEEEIKNVLTARIEQSKKTAKAILLDDTRKKLADRR